MTQIPIKAYHTWMILESSSNEFLQSPQYSWANCSMYLFTLAEVELIPPLLPDSSWNRGENEMHHTWKLHTKHNHCKRASEARAFSCPWQYKSQHPACLLQGFFLCKIHLSFDTWGFSGAASFTLHRRFSSCGRCPINW